MKFQDWLIQRDPQLAEAFGLQTMKKAGQFLGKKALPVAANVGMAFAGGNSSTAPVAHDVGDGLPAIHQQSVSRQKDNAKKAALTLMQPRKMHSR